MSPRGFLVRVVSFVVLTVIVMPVSVPLWTAAGASHPKIISTLRPLHTLRPLTRLVSSNRQFFAELLRDGALVVVGPRSRLLWSNGVSGSDVNPRLELTNEGDLVEYTHPRGPAVWSSGSKSILQGLDLLVQNDGDLVVSSSLSPAWSDAKGDLTQTLSVVGFGDSEGAETDQFLGGALRDADGVTTTFTPHDFPGTAVCDWIENGTMELAVNANVVALFFDGDGFTPCTDPSSHLSPAALDDLTIADMKVAINMLLAGTVQHVLVISPVPDHPSTTMPSDYLAPRLESMVRSYHNPRVSYIDSPSLSVSPTGAVPTTMPCTNLEITGGLCQGPVVNGVRTNLVFATNGHFCLASLTSAAPAVPPPSPAPCPGFQPGAWRWANAEAKAIFSLYGLPFKETLASGFAS
jgi:hypothetical protein